MFADALQYPVRGDGLKRYLLLTGGYIVVSVVLGLVALATLFGAVIGAGGSRGGAGVGSRPTGGPLALPNDVGVVVLAVLAVLALVALIVGVFFGGYYVRVLRATGSGADEMPPLTDVGTFFVDGLAGAVVTVGYFLPVWIPLAAAVATDTDALAVLGAVLVLPVGYLVPVALSAYATGGFAAAFALGRIGNLAATSEYLLAWVLAAVVLGVTGVVNVVFSLVPIVGSLVGSTLGIYAALVAVRLCGRGVAAAASR
ncbi:MAG: DUF4013 domain-containing protein [Haloarculaceae archaeon]